MEAAQDRLAPCVGDTSSSASTKAASPSNSSPSRSEIDSGKFGEFKECVGKELKNLETLSIEEASASAIIVPTAADLAFGIEFGSDRICETSTGAAQTLTCHSARSPYNFGALPLRNFTKPWCSASPRKAGLFIRVKCCRPQKRRDRGRRLAAGLSALRNTCALTCPS